MLCAEVYREFVATQLVAHLKHGFHASEPEDLS